MDGSAKAIFLVDLTCRSLPYDTHLAKGLRRSGVQVDMWLAGCLSGQGGPNCGQHIIDVASRMRGRKLRKVAKAAEYLANGIGLHQSLRTASPDIVHFQWLPFAERLSSLEILNLKWAKTTEAGVVYTIHNVLPHDTGIRYRETFHESTKFQMP